MALQCSIGWAIALQASQVALPSSSVTSFRASSLAMAIRSCGRRHALGLCRLNHQTFPASTPDRLPGVRLLRDWWSLQRRLGVNHVMIATDDQTGKVIGSVEVHTTKYLRQRGGDLTDEQASKLQPYLCSMAVDEARRGEGLGRSLVTAVLQEVQTDSPEGTRIFLNVEAHNVAAVRLYSSCGFRIVSPPGCQNAMMQRVLS